MYGSSALVNCSSVRRRRFVGDLRLEWFVFEVEAVFGRVCLGCDLIRAVVFVVGFTATAVDHLGQLMRSVVFELPAQCWFPWLRDAREVASFVGVFHGWPIGSLALSTSPSLLYLRVILRPAGSVIFSRRPLRRMSSVVALPLRSVMLSNRPLLLQICISSGRVASRCTWILRL